MLPRLGGAGANAPEGDFLATSATETQAANRLVYMTSMRERARELRRNMTPEEVKLWINLKQLNREGCHFRRQVPFRHYILDFVEFSRRLVLEVDGAQHAGLAADVLRDEFCTTQGFRVLRIWNFEVNTQMDGVMDAIRAALREQPVVRVKRERGKTK